MPSAQAGRSSATAASTLTPTSRGGSATTSVASGPGRKGPVPKPQFVTMRWGHLSPAARFPSIRKPHSRPYGTSEEVEDRRHRVSRGSPLRRAGRAAEGADGAHSRQAADRARAHRGGDGGAGV